MDAVAVTRWSGPAASCSSPRAIISAMRALARAILSASFELPPELRCSMVERLNIAMATSVSSTIMLTVATRANPKFLRVEVWNLIEVLDNSLLVNAVDADRHITM